MIEWALQHPFLTFLLILAAIQAIVILVRGRAED